MNFYYSFLLLLVVLSADSEGPQYAKPPKPLDSTLVTVYPNSSSAHLGVLAPVLPQDDVSKIVLPEALTSSGMHNFFLPSNGGFKIATANCQLFNNEKTTVKAVLNLGHKGSKHLI